MKEATASGKNGLLRNILREYNVTSMMLSWLLLLLLGLWLVSMVGGMRRLVLLLLLLRLLSALVSVGRCRHFIIARVPRIVGVVHISLVALVLILVRAVAVLLHLVLVRLVPRPGLLLLLLLLLLVAPTGCGMTMTVRMCMRMCVGRWYRLLYLVAAGELVVVAGVCDLPDDAHVDEAVIVSLDVERIQYQILNPVVVTQDGQVLDMLLILLLLVLVLTAALVIQLVVVAREYSIGDARVDVHFIIMPIHDHIIARLRDPDMRIVVINDHVTVVTLAATRALRWAALSCEESGHTRGTTHPHPLHEEHVWVMRIHLNIYLLL